MWGVIMLTMEAIRDAIEDYLRQEKKNGNKYCILSARDVNRILGISKNYGNPRYRQVCIAMWNVRFFRKQYIEGEEFHADFTVEYKLRLF